MAKKKPDQPENKPPEISLRVSDLRPKLERFGFDPPNDVIDAWHPDVVANVERALFHWVEEYDLGQAGKQQPDADRWPIPEILKPFDRLPPDKAVDAQRLGSAAKVAGRDALSNPYPPESTLSTMWQVGFNGLPEPTNAVAPASPTLPAGELLPPAGVQPPEKAEEPKESEAEIRAKIATERARRNSELRMQILDRMKCARKDADFAERRLNYLKVDVKAVKADFDAAMSHLREAGRELDRLEDGTFELQKTFDGIPNSQQKAEAVAALPATDTIDRAPIDKGAEFDLLTLVKGTLSKTTGCDKELGLSKLQVEKLKSAIEGNTIGNLEKFQRENRNWNRDIAGFGQTAIDKLQDAHAAFRKKFPQAGTPEAVIEEIKAAAPAKAKEAVDGGVTNAAALAEIKAAIIACGEVIEFTTSDDGKEFCGKVSAKLAEIEATLKTSGMVPTVDQVTAIRNIAAGVKAWHDKTDVGNTFGKGLDVPPGPSLDDEKGKAA